MDVQQNGLDVAIRTKFIPREELDVLHSRCFINEGVMLEEITIQFTEKCNVSCPYCFAPKGLDGILSESIFEEFMSFCKKAKPEVIHVTGGEPSLHYMFSQYIMRLSEISSLVVYSNFTMPNITRYINVLNPRDVVFLINYMGAKYASTQAMSTVDENIEEAISKGFRIAFSYTYYAGSKSLENEINSIIDVMLKYRARNLRISQAVSFDRNKEIDIERIRKLYSYVASKLDAWNDKGIYAYFDCPVPPCYIPLDVFNKLRSRGAIAVRCEPKVFVTWELNVTHCYCTMESGGCRKLSSFENMQEAKAYSECLLNILHRQSERRGCNRCMHFNNDSTCGCPTYSV